MFEESVTRIAGGELHLPPDLHHANAQDRRQYGGPGLELIRRAYVDRARCYMDAFWEHGSLADILALCAAFDLIDRNWRREQSEDEYSRATLMEALLAVLGLSAHELLDSGLQRLRT